MTIEPIQTPSEGRERSRELSRRLIAVNDALRGGAYLKCGLEEDRDAAGGPAWRPVLPDGTTAWTCRRDCRDYSDPALADDAMIVHVPASIELPAALPSGCSKLSPNLGALGDAEVVQRLRHLAATDEHAMQRELYGDLDLGDFDTWAEPHATTASGLRSYAHTVEKYHDDFSHSNDPLSGHADWTALQDGGYAKSDGSELVPKDDDIAHRSVKYELTGYPPANGDYSVESKTLYVSGTSTILTICSRMADEDNYYYIYCLDAVERLRKNVAGVVTTLAEDTGISVSGEQLLRLEAVGTTLRYYRGGVERLSAVDGAFSSGSAGFLLYINLSDTPTTEHYDDFKVYRETTSIPMGLFQGLTGAI
jgi:hypothetical protein